MGRDVLYWARCVFEEVQGVGFDILLPQDNPSRRVRTFSFNRASLTGFDLGAATGRGGADTFSSGMVSVGLLREMLVRLNVLQLQVC